MEIRILDPNSSLDEMLEVIEDNIRKTQQTREEISKLKLQNRRNKKQETVVQQKKKESTEKEPYCDIDFEEEMEYYLTDYFYNDYVFRNCYLRDEFNHVTGIKTKEGHTLIPNPNDSRGRRKIKQADFINFGKLLLASGKVEVPTSLEEIKKQLHLLEKEFLDEEEVKKRLDYLSSQSFIEFNSGYSDESFVMADKDEYQKVFDECVAFCEEKTKQYIKR